MPLKLRSALFLLLAATPVGAQAPISGARIDSVFSAYQRTNGPGCAVGVYRNGKIAFARGYGMADLNQGIAISSRTPFYIASTSKQFAAASLTILAMQGLVSLDDPVRKYVPELPASYADAVTLRHLMHHVSGVRDYLGMWAVSGRSFADHIPEEMALDLIARQKALDFTPGSKWSYSNSGYFLISVVVRRASGMSLRDFARVNIFEPLAMLETHFHDDNTMVVPNRAEGYERDERGNYRIVRTSYALVGDGGLYSTIEDLVKWDENFYDNKLAGGGRTLIDRLTTRAVLTSGDTTNYASGLMIDKYRGLPIVSHGGAFIGYRAELLRFPGEHASVGVLCNDYAAPAEALARRVADVVLSERFTPANAVASSAGTTSPRRISAEVLARYPGRYEVMPGVVATVRPDSGLALSIFGNLTPFSARNDSTFEATGVPGVFMFRRLPDGVTGLVAPGFGLDVPARPLGPVPQLSPAQRQEIVGRYYSEELQSTFVVREAGTLLMVRGGYGDLLPMNPISPDVFNVGSARAALTTPRAGSPA